MSPLLEREALLGSLESSRIEALAGRGRLVFLGGEAGSGKTSLVTCFADQAAASMRVLLGVCDGGPPRPMGPLVDIAPALGDRVTEQLAAEQPARIRLFPAVQAALAAQPTLVVFEDAHWADEATLDLIRFLARRVVDAAILVVATYRDDEVGGGHPLTVVMGDLAPVPNVMRMHVPLLTSNAVAELARRASRDVDVGELYRRTGGNAFFVTEVLASDADRLPPSVRDAVLARTARLSLAARHVLAAASVIGLTSQITLLNVVSGQSPGAIDECVEQGVLLDAGDSVMFRHELARQAIEASLPSATRVRLHGLILDALRSSGLRDDRRLAHHAEGGGDARAAITYAPRAASLAARLGSHREAADHYRMALRHADLIPDCDRAQLLECLSYECYLTDQIADAFAARQESLELRRTGDDFGAVGEGLRWLSRLSWFLGRNNDAERYASQAVGVLEPLGAGSRLAMAYSNLAQLRMLAKDDAAALHWGARAVAMAQEIGDREVLSHALNNVGTTLLTRGDVAEGTARLQQSLDIARAMESVEHVARAYTNLGSGCASQLLLAIAERYLSEGIAYCAERDLDSWRLYMEASLALVLVEQGRYDPALQLARGIEAHSHLSPVTQIPALTAQGFVSVRRGKSDACGLLDRAQALAEPTGESQRLVPIALARAELAWVEGRTSQIVAETDAVWPLALAHSNPWDLGALTWWRFVGGDRGEVPPDVPAPFALMLDNRHSEGAREWAKIGCLPWQALALARSLELPDTRQALALLERLEAPGTIRAVTRDMRLRGIPVPRGPRSSTRDNPAGLTSREFEVLQLLVEGLSNTELAHRLTVSEKTAGHHVSAVLRKLGAPSRARAVAIAASLGIPGTERQPT